MKEFWKKIFSVRNRADARTNMAKIILIGWFLPLALFTAALLLVLTGYMNRAAKNTALASAQKATEILKLRLNDCELASKNASYLPVILNSYRDYLADGDRKNLSESVTTFLKQQYRYDSNLKDAVLVFTAEPEELYFTYNNSTGGTYKEIQTFADTALADVLKLSETLDTDTRIIGKEGRVYMVRNLMDSKFNPVAVLTLELNPDALKESLKSVWGYADGALYLQDGEKIVPLLTGGEDLSEAAASGAISSRVADGEAVYDSVGGHSYVSAYLGHYGGIRALVELDNGVIRAERRTYLSFGLVLLILLIPLLVIVRQYEQIYREEIALRDAGIMALQSQINPHFLNNTLEIINWEARLSENYKISGMIEALSTMLSATMNRKAESVHTLREEMNYVDAYLTIIERRFGEQLHVTKEIDETLLEVKVPRLIIQPIVENAVEHGTKAAAGKKTEVFIKIARAGDFLVIEITNSGHLQEADAGKIQMLLSGRDDPDAGHLSVGIKNVNSRLKLMYGEDCGLAIEDGEEDGENGAGSTISTIKIRI